jgi:hypothetical protein
MTTYVATYRGNKLELRDSIRMVISQRGDTYTAEVFKDSQIKGCLMKLSTLGDAKKAAAVLSGDVVYGEQWHVNSPRAMGQRILDEMAHESGRHEWNEVQEPVTAG